MVAEQPKASGDRIDDLGRFAEAVLTASRVSDIAESDFAVIDGAPENSRKITQEVTVTDSRCCCDRTVEVQSQGSSRSIGDQRSGYPER